MTNSEAITFFKNRILELETWLAKIDARHPARHLVQHSLKINDTLLNICLKRIFS